MSGQDRRRTVFTRGVTRLQQRLVTVHPVLRMTVDAEVSSKRLLTGFISYGRNVLLLCYDPVWLIRVCFPEQTLWSCSTTVVSFRRNVSENWTNITNNRDNRYLSRPPWKQQMKARPKEHHNFPQRFLTLLSEWLNMTLMVRRSKFDQPITEWPLWGPI